jgi:hypothetical protein
VVEGNTTLQHGRFVRSAFRGSELAFIKGLGEAPYSNNGRKLHALRQEQMMKIPEITDDLNDFESVNGMGHGGARLPA